jgi:hypothetical protein
MSVSRYGRDRLAIGQIKVESASVGEIRLENPRKCI